MRMIGCDSEFDAEYGSTLASKFFWITYRHDFMAIPGTAFTTDAGWGCMIRCGQMLAASAIICTIFGDRKMSISFTLIR